MDDDVDDDGRGRRAESLRVRLLRVAVTRDSSHKDGGGDEPSSGHRDTGSAVNTPLLARTLTPGRFTRTSRWRDASSPVSRRDAYAST